MAITLADKFEDGILPGRGGWLEQDSLYVTLIDMASNAKRKREAIEKEKQQRKAGRR